MNRLSRLLGAALLAALILSAGCHLTTAAAVVSVRVLPGTGPRTIHKHGIITIRLQVQGIRLNARALGKAPRPGEGHIQVYADGIPGDAWKKADLKRHWLGSIASSTFTLNLSPILLGGPGRHRLIIALAKNNSVLYAAPTATIAVTVTAN